MSAGATEPRRLSACDLALGDIFVDNEQERAERRKARRKNEPWEGKALASVAGPGNARGCRVTSRFMAREPTRPIAHPALLQYGRYDQHRAGSGEEGTMPDEPGGALDSFRGRFAGRVVTADDADYDAVRGGMRVERRH